MSQTTEKSFESYVEQILMIQSGWEKGDLREWDVELALFPARVVAFLAETQPKLWQQMKALHGAGLETSGDQYPRERARSQGDAPRSAAWIQVLRQDLPPRLLQAGSRPQRRGAGSFTRRTG